MMLPDGALSDPELERELRAMRPEIDPEFSAQLDAWAAEGFPSTKEIDRDRGEEARVPPVPLRDRFRRFRARPLLPALAGASVVVLAVTVGVAAYLSSYSSDTDDLSLEPESGGIEQVEGRDAGRASEQLGAPSGTDIGPAPTTVPPVPPRQGQLKPGVEREVIRDASMRLSTEPDQVAEVADGVVEVTERYEGIVVSSDVNTSGDRGRATFDLRIPAQNLQAALADLSDLASVSERNEGTLDVTAPFVSAEERVADAKAEVDALIAQLGEATSTDEIAEIRERLASARSELAAARAELGNLKRETDYSRVAVNVDGDGDADGWSLGDAADDAGSVLEDLAGATLVALAVLLPLGLITVGTWLLFTRIRRARRDKALNR